MKHLRFDGFCGLCRLAAAVAALFLLCPSAVSAAGVEPLKVELVALKVATDKGGAPTLVSAERADAGDVIVYRATYRNVSRDTLHQVQATVPIPPGLVYVPGSATPAALQASQNGREYFSATDPTKTPPFSSWRALRWASRDLAPGAEFVVELRARVGAVEAPQP